ncbi:hypothetical protein OB955_00070 [Halobacteria archaeon AArc-m2/3/4]|uniref:Uncharacterized protein n=1 Tax=Natronoglomus mannanivorans TaxID=2979990 RepID=A0ABT2Q878_9EURY|nr:hypothetical protein [Halobacteria archaeon AArc-m2/3/4]
MDGKEAVNSFIQLYEYAPTGDASLDEPIVTSFPAANHEADWTFILNGDPTETHTVKDIPTSDSTVTVRPTQALIFLGDQHAGIIGAGAGEFYEDQFETFENSIQEAFMSDFEEAFM